MARVNLPEVRGTLSGTGGGTTYQYRATSDSPPFLMIKTGHGGATTSTFTVQVADPDGATWTTLTADDGTQYSFTNDIALRFEPGGSVDVRINCTNYDTSPIYYVIKGS